MSPDDFRNVAEGVQALLVALGVLSAGVWALLRLRLFGELSRAKLEVQQLARAAKEGKGITLRMDISVHSIGTDYFLIADVIVENPGARMYFLDFPEPPFRINRVENFAVAGLTFHEVVRLSVPGTHFEEPAVIPRVGSRVMPASSRLFSLCYQLEKPGMYLVSFVFPTPETIADYDVDSEEHRRFVERRRELEASPVLTTCVEKFICVGGGS